MLFVDIEKAIGDFNLKVNFETNNEYFALLGSSGSGKSITLKCIAGIEKPDKGKIILNGKTLFDSEKKINVSPQERRVGYLFQQYALFPNMTVRQNIEAALHYLPKKDRAPIIDKKIEEFRLSNLENRKPFDLSGGEQQRVALARIMANNPELILLDEPFSALDEFLKWQLMLEMRNALDDFDKDVVLVTHSIDEVYGWSNKLCVLNNGKSETVMDVNVEQMQPTTVSAAKLLGCKNFSKAIIENDNEINCVDWNIKFRVNQKAEITQQVETLDKEKNDTSISIGIFSKDIQLVFEEEFENVENNSGDASGKNQNIFIKCKVAQIINKQNDTDVILETIDNNTCLCATIFSETKKWDDIKVNDIVYACIVSEKLLILD